MASSQESKTSSGYSSSQASVTAGALNPHYLCYWLDSCKGQHELNQCNYRRNELHGKLGIYYSSLDTPKSFIQYPFSEPQLEHNCYGYKKVHLLLYNDDRKEILFGLKWCKESKNDQQKCLLLTFPSAEPCERNEIMSQIPSRAFHWLTEDKNFINQCLKQGLKHRFLFQHANVIYPVHLTREQASKLTQEFVSNEEFQSLHRFPLLEILRQLPPWPNYIVQKETTNDLAQISHIEPTGIKLGDYRLWHVAATCLMCIREYVLGGFDTFLMD